MQRELRAVGVVHRADHTGCGVCGELAVLLLPHPAPARGVQPEPAHRVHRGSDATSVSGVGERADGDCEHDGEDAAGEQEDVAGDPRGVRVPFASDG